MIEVKNLNNLRVLDSIFIQSGNISQKKGQSSPWLSLFKRTLNDLQVPWYDPCCDVSGDTDFCDLVTDCGGGGGGVNIYNSDGIQTDATRLYDGNGGELGFVNMKSFAVIGTDDCFLGGNRWQIKSTDYTEIQGDSRVTLKTDTGGTIQIMTSNVNTSTATIGQVLTMIGLNGEAEWQDAPGGTASWNLVGNAGTNPPTDFIGTTDGQPLFIKSDGAILFQDNSGNTWMNLDISGGEIFIGDLFTSNSTTVALYPSSGVIFADANVFEIRALDDDYGFRVSNQVAEKSLDFRNKFTIDALNEIYTIGDTLGTGTNVFLRVYEVSGIIQNSISNAFVIQNDINQSQLTVTAAGELNLAAYPESRDDSGSTTPVNFLYTDASGNVLSAPYAGAGGINLGNSNLTQTGASRIYDAANQNLEFDNLDNLVFNVTDEFTIRDNGGNSFLRLNNQFGDITIGDYDGVFSAANISINNQFGTISLSPNPNDGTGFVSIDGSISLRNDVFAFGTTAVITDGKFHIPFSGGTGAATVDLSTPGINLNSIFVISDLDGIAGSNTITLDAGVGNTITSRDGVAQTYTIINNGGSVTITNVTSTKWMVIATNG